MISKIPGRSYTPKKPNPAEPQPKILACGIAEPSRNPPNPLLTKGGEGGFLKFVANLRANPFLRAIEEKS
jgi:hypothetical protein